MSVADGRNASAPHRNDEAVEEMAKVKGVCSRVERGIVKALAATPWRRVCVGVGLGGSQRVERCLCVGGVLVRLRVRESCIGLWCTRGPLGG